jgi:hypothetical protein
LHGKKLQKIGPVLKTVPVPLKGRTKSISSFSGDSSFQKKFAPYIIANTKIRQALSLRKPFQTREELKSKQLEQFLIIAKREAQVGN